MRLLGIDFFRIIAAFGVVVIHGLGGVPIDSHASKLVQGFSAFSVPFFLATAFYFAGNSLQSPTSKFSLAKRTQRILIPFACWTGIYLLSRVAKQVISKDNSFNKVVSDPISLLFGSAGVQLYFLPLLAVGTVAILVVVKILKIKRLRYLAPLAVVSCLIFGWLQSTDNLFKLGQGIAFAHLLPTLNENPFLRVILVLLVWVISCLPYIFLSLILTNSYIKSNLENKKVLNIVTFIAGVSAAICLAVISSKGANAYLVILLSFSVLILGLYISRYLKNLTLLQKLGSCTFGIYLTHSLFTDGLTPVLGKINHSLIPAELSASGLLIVSLMIFSFSFILTYLISLNKVSSRLLLGE